MQIDLNRINIAFRSKLNNSRDWRWLSNNSLHRLQLALANYPFDQFEFFIRTKCSNLNKYMGQTTQKSGQSIGTPLLLVRIIVWIPGELIHSPEAQNMLAVRAEENIESNLQFIIWQFDETWTLNLTLLLLLLRWSSVKQMSSFAFP